MPCFMSLTLTSFPNMGGSRLVFVASSCPELEEQQPIVERLEDVKIATPRATEQLFERIESFADTSC